ncbi:hypothetical protein DY000_02025725 [Brassica cretica]|uniref:Uncharacterized protein n=1 Tax=Brassica cretica TaxID=69181 RepID=A0ABQ7E9Y1_BRACR|nr:hypothetical protein DY000_02025725 [Brassica cretica]
MEFLEAFGCIWSSRSERHTKVARVLSSGDTKVEHPRATPQSDLPRSLPARATSSSRSRFDGARHEESVGSDLLGATMLEGAPIATHEGCYVMPLWYLAVSGFRLVATTPCRYAWAL